MYDDRQEEPLVPPELRPTPGAPRGDEAPPRRPFWFRAVVWTTALALGLAVAWPALYSLSR